MTTPAFVAQDSTTLATVRYYTQYDPYYYTVDNRPLQDLAANISTISAGGGDSARRAVLLTQLGLSEVFRSLFSGGATGYVTGLSITTPGSNTVRVNPGAFYSLDAVNTTVSTQVLKQALLIGTNDFTVTAPLTAGQSSDYLIQIENSTLNLTNMATSALPFVDATNSFLPGLLLNGELKLSLKSGAAATTGTQVTPTADSGWTPLYVVTATNGAANPTVKFATGSPSYAKVSKTPVILYPSSGAATITNINSVPVATFADSATSSIAVPVPVQTDGINPYAPLKITLVYSASVNSGNAQVQTSYLALASGGSTGSAPVALTAEVLAAPVTANTLGTYTMTYTVPNTAFASFVAGAWTVSVQKLYLSIARLGAAGPDTLAGNLFIHDVILSQ
jgi:hypothetical protein